MMNNRVNGNFFKYNNCNILDLKYTILLLDKFFCLVILILFGCVNFCLCGWTKRV